jgi:hypothetical protein
MMDVWRPNTNKQTTQSAKIIIVSECQPLPACLPLQIIILLEGKETLIT